MSKIPDSSQKPTPAIARLMAGFTSQEALSARTNMSAGTVHRIEDPVWCLTLAEKYRHMYADAVGRDYDDIDWRL